MTHRYSPGVVRPGFAAIVALGVLLVSPACADSPSMTEEDAATYTRGALREIGLREIQIVEGPRPGTYGATGIPVWEVEAVVDGGRVEMAIERDGSYVRFVRDVADTGGPLLTQQQIDELSEYSDNPAADRRRDQLFVPGVVAGVLLSLTVAALVGVALQRGVRSPGTTA